MSDPVLHKDAVGSWIQPGDFVCYAAMSGQSTKLKFGIVTELTRRKVYWKDIPTLRVITVTGWNPDSWELQANGRPVTIDRLENVLTIPETHLPYKAYALLVDAYDKRQK